MDSTKDSFSTKIPRYQLLLSVFFFYVFAYFFFLFGPISNVLDYKILFLIRWSPVIAILGFGFYAAYTIIRNVINLKNYPEEAESLLKDVAEAKDGLRKRGFKGDL